MATDPPRPSADTGLFGPDSVTWRIHADPSMALGGLRALMLQALHPLAMAGVAQHSSYRRDPWGRLSRTAEYIGTVTYGTTDEAIAAGVRVRRVHRGLAGVEPESGVAYQVEDTSLLLWVHCAQVDSFLDAYRRCGGRLRRGEADAYVGEQARAAALVGVPAEDVPVTTGELRRYLDSVRPQLRASGEARAALWFLFNPPMPLAARPAWMYLTGLAFGLLPRWARRSYGVPGPLCAVPGADLAAGLGGRSLSTALRLVPQSIRSSPARAAALERAAAR
jgi:uncharacterized protein (DUF2236 family)